MNTNFGMVEKGSILSYQQKLSTDYITNMYADQFLKLPICNLMQSDFNFTCTCESQPVLEKIKVSHSEINAIEQNQETKVKQVCGSKLNLAD